MSSQKVLNKLHAFNYTLVRISKTTALQRKWLQSLNLGVSSKSSRQPVFGQKSEMLKL